MRIDERIQFFYKRGYSKPRIAELVGLTEIEVRRRINLSEGGRKCLGCSGVFFPSHSGHRLCQHCKARNKEIA